MDMTAMQELFKDLESLGIDLSLVPVDVYLEIEKHQICTAFDFGCYDFSVSDGFVTGDNYYEKNYLPVDIEKQKIDFNDYLFYLYGI